METLSQYFSYTNDPEKARDIFLSLDNQLQIIHSKGYSVEINSSSIVYENGFIFSRINKGLTKETRKSNIEDLAKLAIGTYFSIPTGTFSDYTHLPNDYIMENFNIIETSIQKAMPNDEYYREVLVNANIGYYNDYLRNLKRTTPQGKANESSRVLNYATPQGKAMTNNDEAAFINIVFYPLIMTLTAILSYMIYILIR